MSSRIVLILIAVLAGTVRTQTGCPADSVNKVLVKTDAWFGSDKIRHMTGSMIATTFTAQIARRQFNLSRKDATKIAIGITFSLGLAKETFDHTRRDNIFSWKDLTADLLGITLGVLLLNID